MEDVLDDDGMYDSDPPRETLCEALRTPEDWESPLSEPDSLPTPSARPSAAQSVRIQERASRSFSHPSRSDDRAASSLGERASRSISHPSRSDAATSHHAAGPSLLASIKVPSKVKSDRLRYTEGRARTLGPAPGLPGHSLPTPGSPGAGPRVRARPSEYLNLSDLTLLGTLIDANRH